MLLIKARDAHGAERAVRRWNPEKHPRDKRGRFVETGGHVRLADGSVARVVGRTAAGRVEVEHADGTRVTADARTLEVVAPGTKLTDARREPRAAVGAVPVKKLREGDTAMIDHPVSGRPEPGTILELRPHGDRVEMDVRRADGSVDTTDMDRDMVVDRVDADTKPDDHPDDRTPPAPPPPVTRPPAPTGILLARPALYTYQRQKIVALGLDRDRAQSATVRQAAASVRLRMPLTAAQSSALADAIRAHAGADGIRPVQARSLDRITHRLDAAAAEVHGHTKPDLPTGRAGAVATRATDLTEGDTVALARRDGAADVVRIHAIRSTMGGRVLSMDLEHDDGRHETRTVSGRATAWLLPDRPDDTPVPPDGPRREHIDADRVRTGDTLLLDGTPHVVTDVRADPARGIVVQWHDEHSLYESSLKSDDGGPSAVRLERGPASADQPWDAVMAAEHPEQVDPTAVRVGDRVSIPTRFGTITGIVHDTEPAPSESGVPGANLSIRRDDGRMDTIALYNDTHAGHVTRLIKADGNAAARIGQERRAREQRARAREIRDIIDALVTEQRDTDLGALGITIGHPSDDLMRSTINGMSIRSLIRRTDTAGRLARIITPYDDMGRRNETQNLAEQRIVPLLEQIAQRQRENLIASLTNATAGMRDSNDILQARKRVAAQFKETPPPVDTARIGDLLAETAAAMRGVPRGETEVPRPDIPQPAASDLAARIAAYRAALPDPAAIGSRQVVRHMFTQPTLADLEAGRAPAVAPATISIPDVAEDGGPGATAMRHLDIVMAAGRDLDAELQRRAAAIGGFTPEREAESARVSEQVEALRAQRRGLWDAAFGDAPLDDFARGNGFADYADLRAKVEAARMHDTPAEYHRLAQLAEQARAARRAARDAIDAQRHAINTQIGELEKHAISAKDRADAQRAAALAILRDVRPDGLGGAKLTYRQATGQHAVMGERSELVKAMRWAEQHYPTDWLAKARDRGQLFATPDGTERAYRLGAVQRGHYSDSRREIRLSKDGAEKVTGSGDRGRVAVHELGHGMEQAVPGVLPLQNSYLWSRSSRGEVGSRTRDPRKLMAGYKNEAAYHDEFPEAYSGKDYPGGAVRGQSDAYELLTTGMESLMAGSPYLDPSFRQWLLGTLATV